MPEYLAPGVYVEETSFRSKSIEGVSTTTTGFIGPTRYGSIDLEPDIITSLGEFERFYGDGQPLEFDGKKMDNYMWHAARAFFTEGGKRLYVSRVFKSNPSVGDGRASANSTDVGASVTVQARYPGVSGNFRLRLRLRAGQNILGQTLDSSGQSKSTLGALTNRDIVWILNETSPPSSPPASGDFFRAEWDTTQTPPQWIFRGAIGSPIASPLVTRLLSALIPSAELSPGDAIRVVTLSITVISPAGEILGVWNDLPLDPQHTTAGIPDSMFSLFSQIPENRNLPIVISAADENVNGLDVLAALFDGVPNLGDRDELTKGIEKEFVLQGGSDGLRPESPEYEGKDNPATTFKTGLKQFEDLEDISIVAAPGITWDYANYRGHANTIMGQLISHAQSMRYRIAVLDSVQGHSISDVRKVRAKIDSSYAALYYPWVKILDPNTRKEIDLPPSGFVAGIYARNDINRGVWKAPANEVVNLAIGFEQLLNKSQQDVLNPEGINCFRFFEGRGFRLWGARTISSDPEWKYVNLRRYFAYLERSIDKGTQWAVFEPNGEQLWGNVRRTIEDFLLNEFQMGALLGEKPEKAYFVKCDRSTMTQNDLDNGRLICLIGVAALRPAEFVIFRIGQWTADRKV
jgi:hypothetical protein